MRSIIMILLLVMGSTALLAQQRDRKIYRQYSQGGIVLGGAMSGRQLQLGDSDELSGILEGKLSLAYFVKDQLAIGFNVAKYVGFFGEPGNIQWSSFRLSQTNLRAFGRYYFTGDRRFNLFAEVGTGIELSPDVRTPNGNRLFSDNWTAYSAVGVSIPIKRHVSIDLSTELEYIRPLDPSIQNLNGGFRTKPLSIGLNVRF